MALPTLTSNAICGVWVKKDEEVAKKIKDYLARHLSKEIIESDLEKLSFLQGGRKHSKYLVLLSKNSKDDHQFIVFLTSVLYHLYYMKLVSQVVLVVTDRKSNELTHMPINLQSFDRIRAGDPLTDEDLHKIYLKLAEPPKSLEKFLPVGNMGIGLAWSYFYGYLRLILPAIEERISKSETGKRNRENMSKKFFILIPESCKTPEKFTDVDSRFVPEGPLDAGVEKCRAGQPSRCYQNFVYSIKGKDKKVDKYFCGEFATPVLVLWKMLESNAIDQNEMARQAMLFHGTLKAIVESKRNPFCYKKAVIVSYAEQDNLADMLYEYIGNEEEMVENSEVRSEQPGQPFSLVLGTSTVPSIGSIVDIETITVVSAEDGEMWKDSILQTWNIPEHPEQGGEEDFESKCFKVKESTFEDLNPRLVFPSVFDLERPGERTASNKLFIILTQGLMDQMEKHANALIHHPVWFPRTTILLDVDEDKTPDWLEKSGVDYIDTKKGYKFIWKRIYGSVCGVSSISGEEGEDWKKISEGQQKQKDRLPVGHVAEGLAWGYYLNYLDIIGPNIAERIKKTEQFTAGLMPSKLFILVPFSCFSYPTLTKADENITNAGRIETLTIQIAGNTRKYETGMHKICADGKEYFACVEYCTPVLVLYEMEAEGKAGLTPEQKEAQLQVFYRCLKKLCSNADYSQDIQFICYDDQSNDAKSLSSLLVENIEKWL